MEHIHTRSRPADKVEYHTVEEWHRGFAGEAKRKDFEEVALHRDSVGVEYRKDSVEERHRDFAEYHILNKDLLHPVVVAVPHKDFAEYHILN